MEPLQEFIDAAKAKGASDEFLVSLLRERGWPAKKIYAVLGRQYAAEGLAIPEPPGRMEAAREAFFHLLAFSTLATWACAAGSIWFEVIEAWFPDKTFLSYWSLDRVSWQLASVIVAFPVFLWASRNVLRELAASPDKAESPVRRWLTNLALFVTALVCIGDLINFLARFLGGGLTTPFALKSLVVLVLAGGVFLYYSRGLNRADQQRAWHVPFAWSAAISIGISIALGFGLSGSPATLRLYTEDFGRIDDLYRVATQISDKRQPLPADLSRLTVDTVDEVTQQPYEYRILAGTKYELCATFGIATHPRARKDEWTHPAGRHCFELDTLAPPGYPVQYFSR